MDSNDDMPKKMFATEGGERTIEKICQETGKKFKVQQFDWGAGWFPDPQFCPEIEEQKQKKFEEDEAQRELEGRIAVMEAKWKAEVPPIMREFDKSKLNAQNLVIPREWKYGKKGLIMHGVSGTGKTRILWQTIRHLTRKGIRWECHTTRRLQEEMGFKYSTNKDSIIARITKVDVLALDDLGKEKQNPEWESNLFEILDTRANRGKPTLITTNFVGKTYCAKFADQELGKALLRRFKEFYIDAPFLEEQKKEE